MRGRMITLRAISIVIFIALLARYTNYSLAAVPNHREH
jgi:hypothetical protein